MTWRQISPSSQTEQPEPQVSSSAEVAELERQLSELRAAHPIELAHAKQSAFQEGLHQGREDAAAAIRDCAQKLAATLTELTSFKRKLRLDAEAEVVKLSLAIARRILNRELATDPEALEGIVHAALSKLQNRDVWQVRVGPYASEIASAYLDRAGFGGTVKVVVEPALHPGDLVIDTPAGELDASVNTQLQEIERGFAERLAIR